MINLDEKALSPTDRYYKTAASFVPAVNQKIADITIVMYLYKIAQEMFGETSFTSHELMDEMNLVQHNQLIALRSKSTRKYGTDFFLNLGVIKKMFTSMESNEHESLYKIVSK